MPQMQRPGQEKGNLSRYSYSLRTERTQSRARESTKEAEKTVGKGLEDLEKDCFPQEKGAQRGPQEEKKLAFQAESG